VRSRRRERKIVGEWLRRRKLIRIRKLRREVRKLIREWLGRGQIEQMQKWVVGVRRPRGREAIRIQQHG
jgi:hypothetical protein